ncbi:unnamed protein product [Periconia digitata]|uniref:Uncharacterized protein n=1 Tax=Periconia digitata TaxID=1303443 RepID=A0A9W4U1D1_9PLEO|nr:unnamed protein product [Periconia digitata]
MSDEHENEKINLEDRLRECIAHTQSEISNGRQPNVCSHFVVPVTKPPSTALILIRNAETAGLASFINAGPKFEIYSLGVPPAIQTFQADPQWWAGMSKAEMRAGPLATPAEIRGAGKDTKRKEKKTKEKEKEMTEKDAKLREGFKRQVLGLPIRGKVKEKTWKLVVVNRDRPQSPEEAEAAG